jgi:hypothetical protein
VDALSFEFSAALVSQLVKTKVSELLTDYTPDNSETTSFKKELAVCNQTRSILNGLLNHTYQGDLENIYVNAQTQMLLLCCLNCTDDGEKTASVGCKFLANDLDRQKIQEARRFLMQHIGEPITIKELSRKVAINECYLKKCLALPFLIFTKAKEWSTPNTCCMKKA